MTSWANRESRGDPSPPWHKPVVLVTGRVKPACLKLTVMEKLHFHIQEIFRKAFTAEDNFKKLVVNRVKEGRIVQ